MVEYTIEEAVGLLEQNHINAMANKKSLDEDIAFLRDQITTVRALRAASSPAAELRVSNVPCFADRGEYCADFQPRRI